MVSADVANAMCDVYAQKYGLGSREEARAAMMADPHHRALLERESLGGIDAAIKRDRQLAYGAGRLAALEALLNLGQPSRDRSGGQSAEFLFSTLAGEGLEIIKPL